MGGNGLEQFRKALGGPFSDARAPLTPRVNYWSWFRAALAFQPARPTLPDAARSGAGLVDADVADVLSTRSTAPAPAPDPPTRSWGNAWTRLRHSGVAVVACAALGVVAAVGATSQYASYLHAQQARKGFLQNHCGTSNPALVTKSDSECVGVTDGSDGSGVFGYSLEPVLAAIRAENSSATRGGRYVTVALLAPLSSAGRAKDLALDQFAAEAEGAYTAVERTNAGDSTLKIRLVLASTGSADRYWKYAVDQLTHEKNLVAVAGMGLASVESLKAARELSKADIPMVAGAISADGFDTTGTVDGHGPINGLTRVSLTNATLLAAVGKELESQKYTAAMVRTSASANDGHTDLYAESLYRDFLSVKGLKKHLVQSDVFTFAPGINRDPRLNFISEDLCDLGPSLDTVYFAAPEKYLPDFLDALSRRSCRQQHITVVTVSDAGDLDLSNDALHQLNSSITVMYPSLPSSTALRSYSNGDRALYNAFLRAFTRDHHGRTFLATHATHGYSAVFAHDAVLAAATAIHKAATATAGVPSRHAVLDRLYTLNDNSVPGASGRFGIDRTGNRTNTTVPVTVNRIGAIL